MIQTTMDVETMVLFSVLPKLPQENFRWKTVMSKMANVPSAAASVTLATPM